MQNAPTEPGAPRSREDDVAEVDLRGEAFAAVGAVSASHTRRQEQSDAYPSIARVNPSWRVIRCRDDMQWILQRRDGATWRGNSFHRDRDVLLDRIASRCGEVDAAVVDAIRALPVRYERK